MHGQQSGMGMATRCKHSYTLSDNLYIFLSDTTLSKQHLYKKKISEDFSKSKLVSLLQLLQAWVTVFQRLKAIPR